MCEDNRSTFMAIFHNILLAPYLCDKFVFNYYVNEFGPYLFISQRVLHGTFRGKEEKLGYSTTYCKEETCIFGKK